MRSKERVAKEEGEKRVFIFSDFKLFSFMLWIDDSMLFILGF